MKKRLTTNGYRVDSDVLFTFLNRHWVINYQYYFNSKTHLEEDIRWWRRYQ